MAVTQKKVPVSALFALVLMHIPCTHAHACVCATSCWAGCAYARLWLTQDKLIDPTSVTHLFKVRSSCDKQSLGCRSEASQLF